MTQREDPAAVHAPHPAEARSRDELIAAIQAGATPRWLMFWGHTPKPDGGVGPHLLSQWWPCRFSVDGVDYASAEQFMMAAKARLFSDEASLAKILAAPTPAEAKNLGRLVEGFDETAWNAARFEAVVIGNAAKFSQDPTMRAYLLSTKGRVLVEASPRDRIWGIGLGSNHPNATDPRLWRGENLLGFALAEARDRLAIDAAS